MMAAVLCYTTSAILQAGCVINNQFILIIFHTGACVNFLFSLNHAQCLELPVKMLWSQNVAEYSEFHSHLIYKAYKQNIADCSRTMW